MGAATTGTASTLCDPVAAAPMPGASATDLGGLLDLLQSGPEADLDPLLLQGDWAGLLEGLPLSMGLDVAPAPGTAAEPGGGVGVGGVWLDLGDLQGADHAGLQLQHEPFAGLPAITSLIATHAPAAAGSARPAAGEQHNGVQLLAAGGAQPSGLAAAPAPSHPVPPFSPQITGTAGASPHAPSLYPTCPAPTGDASAGQSQLEATAVSGEGSQSCSVLFRHGEHMKHDLSEDQLASSGGSPWGSDWLHQGCVHMSHG